MSFYDQYLELADFDFVAYWNELSDQDIEQILEKDRIDYLDFLALLSKRAERYLEPMAQRAQKLTIKHFGKVVFLYTPLYLANYCVNQCLYCSFNTKESIERKKLGLSEIAKEAEAIAKMGFRHILILTGESRRDTSVSYIKEAVELLTDYFDSIAIEIYPLKTEEYRELVEAGVDSLTIYQEVYNQDVYDQVHLAGPKKDYQFRLNAPERGCQAGMRAVNIGALLGLNDWRKEAFFTGLHAKYLQDNYLETEISLSLPRIRPHLGAYQPKDEVQDKKLVQNLLALRLFLPRAGLNISTRERAELRDNLIGLGVTKMSAAAKTSVGGYAQTNETIDINVDQDDCQFETSDKRSVKEVTAMLHQQGYQSVFKNWHIF
ncbi:2-iminoacetate synthase ThiH [Selenihalanaerobacter shriftii]|uniref:2-iminoacetate synthase n=1 Tax=Selenihalanaerobacter shriftii TaxID=142842 RepID=A0A1T4LC54_9FIRM|nr:2-iminoacetate synthase ThiH [Selenihalanaerobacter shriftii]SJZ52241.1 2-iminoacetate synthase [Selenihalanaerobacter shriftii]